MGYTDKLETDAVTGPLFVCMTQRNRTDDRAKATESKFYLPAASTPPSVASRLERIWATLFSHGIETST